MPQLLFALSLVLGACGPFRSESQTLPSQWTAFRLNRELNPVVAAPASLHLDWKFKAGGGISSSPTVAGETVYVASNDGHVYALDLRTGRPRWSYRAGDDVMTAPLVYHGTIVAGEGNNHSGPSMFFPPKYLLVGDGQNAIFGLDQATGKLVWQRSVPGSAMPTGAIVDGAYVEHDGAGMVFAFGVTDGAYRWRTYLGSTAAMVAANNVRGNLVVTGGDYPNAVVAFDGTNGKIIWRRPFPAGAGGFDDCPLAGDGRYIYGTYNARPADSKYDFVGYTTPAIQHAYALDDRNGRVVWDTTLARGILPINNSTAIPLVYRGALYLGSAMLPSVFALDAKSGRLLWQRRVGGPVKGGMVARDGTVYFGDLQGDYWAGDARRGAVLGKTKMLDGFNIGSPIIVGNNLIVGSAHGYVFATPLDAIVAHKR